MLKQSRGLIASIVSPVAEMQPSTREPPRELLEAAAQRQGSLRARAGG
jgi:hypothetical protein